ncbi:hypothetical protein LTS08_000101 [Lithohypha guttulata]|nr:hypothetical protein LTS08_000101 [Lithohypha guttulata]
MLGLPAKPNGPLPSNRAAAQYNFKAPKAGPVPGQTLVGQMISASDSPFAKTTPPPWKKQKTSATRPQPAKNDSAPKKTIHTEDTTENSTTKKSADSPRQPDGSGKRKFDHEKEVMDMPPSKRNKTTNDPPWRTTHNVVFAKPQAESPLPSRGGDAVNQNTGYVPSAPPGIHFDRATMSFMQIDLYGNKTPFAVETPTNHPSIAQVSPSELLEAEPAKDHSPTEHAPVPAQSERLDKTASKYKFRASTTDYNRKRSRPHYDPNAKEETGADQPATKRARLGVNNKVDTATATDTFTNTTDEPPKRGKKKPKRRSVPQKKATSQTALEMQLHDLIPHYTPDLCWDAEEEEDFLRREPVTFMDLPTEMRRNIWDKVFEDEAYNFKVKRYCTRDHPKFMIPTKPKSFGCLLINKTCAEEVADQMYKSARLELDFGRLKPPAMREFIQNITAHRIGERSERIFFLKKFGLQKVDLGAFKNAREIVSQLWTVEGDDDMELDDYKNNRIDPTQIFNHPESKPNLKGLKERRFWADQELATQRYQKHIAGRCHPLWEPLDVENRIVKYDNNCPFNDHCLNLEKTKMVIVLKYKYSCLNGRHFRQKEIIYDLYPLLGERLAQVVPPKSKFHKRCNKKACQELNAAAPTVPATATAPPTAAADGIKFLLG